MNDARQRRMLRLGFLWNKMDDFTARPGAKPLRSHQERSTQSRPQAVSEQCPTSWCCPARDSTGNARGSTSRRRTYRSGSVWCARRAAAEAWRPAIPQRNSRTVRSRRCLPSAWIAALGTRPPLKVSAPIRARPIGRVHAVGGGPAFDRAGADPAARWRSSAAAAITGQLRRQSFVPLRTEDLRLLDHASCRTGFARAEKTREVALRDPGMAVRERPDDRRG